MDSKKNTKTFTCEHCDYKSRYRCTLKLHVKVIHKRGEAEQFSCEYCSFVSYNKSNLSRHMKVHENRSPFKCKLCDNKTFHGKPSLDHHILKFHSEISSHLITSKIHQCELCSYKTTSMSHMKQHVIIHIRKNEPKLTCEKSDVTSLNDNKYKQLSCYYDKITAENVLLEKSNENILKIKNHFDPTEMIKYACNECRYVTYRKSDLKKHLLIHSKVCPYRCVFCSKRFSQKHHLDFHIVSKHPENENVLLTRKVHQCNICKYKTICRSHLTRHKEKHKKEQKKNNI